jgi:hypothetical protein
MLSGSPTKPVPKTTSRKENPSPPTLPQHNQRLDIQPAVPAFQATGSSRSRGRWVVCWAFGRAGTAEGVDEE